MRRAIWLVSVLAILWSLWWGVGSALLTTGTERWLEARKNEGWQAEADVSTGISGYPGWIATDLESLRLADPETGVAISAPNLALRAAAWWPGQSRVELPEETMRLSTPEGWLDLTMAEGLMALDLAASTRLELRRLAWTAASWGLAAEAGDLASAESLTLAMDQDSALPELYRFALSAPAFRPGSVFRAEARIPESWPVTMERLDMRLAVTFDRPWDRFALEERRPQPRVIVLELAEAKWGGLRLNMSADLVVDAAGRASGELALQAENWRDMLRIAVETGLMPAGLFDQAEQVLGQFAALSGNPETIDVQLNLREGVMFLGFIPLGAAPLFRLP